MGGLNGFHVCVTPPPQSFPHLCLNSSDVPVTHLVLGFAVEGNAPPPKKITSWFLSKGQGKTRDDSADYIPHDIYVIGTQEDPLGEKEWLEILKNSLQEITSITFKMVSSWPRPQLGLQRSWLCKAGQDILEAMVGSACQLSTSKVAWLLSGSPLPSRAREGNLYSEIDGAHGCC